VAAHTAQQVRGESAFERIYRHHARSVYRYALALLRDPDDAEHATRTTFQNAYGALQRGVTPSSADIWLLAIAHAVCRQRCGYDESVADELARWDAALELAACLDPERAISRELDGLLTDGERRALHDHLRACPECRTVASTQLAQQAAIRGLQTVQLPPSLGQVSSMDGVI
jgi:DNA-directed RNA polymerase specialized sigma24 family protein